MFSLPQLASPDTAKALLVPLAIVLLLMAEHRWAWRAHLPGRALGNWGMALLNALLPLLLPGLALVAAAEWASQRGWGLFNAVNWPAWLEGLLAVIALDCALYWQHRFSHWQPLLWRLHRVHHSDVALDVSTGLRFHPLEALLSAFYKAACVAALGASPVAAGSFAIVLALGSLFSHANLALPGWLQRGLEKCVVTPAMHRVHHSVVEAESQHNFGFFLPWWDWLFGSYQARAAAGEQLRLGQEDDRHPAAQQLRTLLGQPFATRPRNGTSNTL